MFTLLIHNLIRSKTYKAKQKEASEIILTYTELPIGTIKAEKETLKNAYDTLKVAHHLSRAAEFIKCISKASDGVVQRLRFYAKSELQSVKEWVESSHFTDEDFKFNLNDILTSLDISPLPNSIDITLLKQSTNAEDLILITDLYRDFDDWLTLIHVVMSGKYKNISLITSNEINGRCAQITQSYRAHLIALAKSLHGYELTINVYQGLAAFDFTCFHEDYAEPYLGVHYPDKMYAAMMRAPELHSNSENKSFYQFADFQQQLASFRDRLIDVICIGKIADLDLALMLGYDAGISFNNLTILGGRPNTLSTNTNCPAYHVQNLPSNMIMLDSRYGKEPNYKISRKMFLDRSDTSFTDANPVEAYLHRMLALLHESDDDDFKTIAILTLKHLEQLQYDIGNTFDVFTLFADEYLGEHPIQVFFTSEDITKNPTMFDDLSNVQGKVIISLPVFYPKESIKSNFVIELTKLVAPLIHYIRRRNMPLDLEQIHRTFPLLSHYGNFIEAPAQRATNTLTQLDEYHLIIRSLLILDVLSNTSLNDEAAANILYEGFSDSDFGFEKLTKPGNMIPNIKYLRGLLSELSVESFSDELFSFKHLQLAYILHDLGKCCSFVSANNLCPSGAPTAAAHDFYLEQYLEKDENKALSALFFNEKIMTFVKILDLLGHSPYKLQAPGPFASLKDVADTAIFIKNYGEKVHNESLELCMATRDAILKLFIKQAEVLSLDPRILSSIDPRSSFTALEPEQMNAIAFIMWTGGLRLGGPSDRLNSFTQAWHQSENQVHVRPMVALLMNNLEQTEGYCFLYNVTGLLHKTIAQIGLKGFLGGIDQGGMGANMNDVITVLFPFILSKVSTESVKTITLVAHNDFQVKQLIEMVLNVLPNLAGLKANANCYPSINFDAPEMHQELDVYFSEFKAIQTSESRKIQTTPTRGFFEHKAGPETKNDDEVDTDVIKKKQKCG